MDERRGFLASLFDMSFSEFVTTRIIVVLYWIAIILAAIAALIVIVGGFAQSFWMGLLSLVVVGPLVFFLYVLVSRVWLELIIVFFRIAENTARLVEGQNPPPPAS